MTLWARADVSYVSVPASSGGCGQPHTRPVVNGAPAKDFPLNCQGCENYLRADIARSGGNKKVRTVNGDYGLPLKDRYLGLWGATKDTVPESPDDELSREHAEAANITKNAASQTETFAQIGEAVASNRELMAKFMELQMQMLGSQQPVLAKTADTPVEVLQEQPTTADTWNQHMCLDCQTPIVRSEGQKGALPQRCPDCKAAKAAARRKAA